MTDIVDIVEKMARSAPKQRDPRRSSAHERGAEEMTDTHTFKIGDDVETKCGWPAQILCDPFKCDERYAIAVAVMTPEGRKSLHFYHADGRYLKDVDSDMDIIPKPKVRKCTICLCYPVRGPNDLITDREPLEAVAGSHFRVEIREYEDGRLEIERVKP